MTWKVPRPNFFLCSISDSTEGRIIIEDEGSGEGHDAGLCSVFVLPDDNTGIETHFDELPKKSTTTGLCYGV